MIISTLGGHSALEICLGAHKLGLKTLVIVQKGRDKTYTDYFQNLVDEYISVDSFSELTSKNVTDELQKKKAIFIPHRYCQVYCDLKRLEKNFSIPIYGNKYLLKYEEREGKFNQYQLMDKAGIDYPKKIKNPKDIDRLTLVKVKEAKRRYERAFFFADNFHTYQRKSQEMIKQGIIKEKDLEVAVIEEYLIGAQINFNFFYSPLTQRIELLGTDTRRQTNIDGLLRIPAWEQMETKDNINPSYIESGHIAVTVKESLLEKAYSLADKLVIFSKKVVPPGIIGPFALQTAVLPGPPSERIIVFDISLRIAGSPGTVFTPYSYYLYGKGVSFGERIAMEISNANKLNLINKIIT